jgi:hypothetical protein
VKREDVKHEEEERRGRMVGVKGLVRLLLNVTTVLSLVLCLATLALAVRSYWVYEIFRIPWDQGSNLRSRAGTISKERIVVVVSRRRVLSTEVAANYWGLTLFFGLLPAIRIVQHFYPHRSHQGSHCLTCGYDLRATPDRCPECGTIPTR